MAVRDIIQAAGGSAATSAAVYVEDVFSTYLYTGNGASQTITNGIDLSTKGGMVWIKSRTVARAHHLFDTARGVGNEIYTNNTSAQANYGQQTAFNVDGFSVSSGVYVNNASEPFASWTFRKQAKFFDVVTYTGDGTAGRQIAHSLGSVPGMIIVKRLNAAGPWLVYHKSLSSSIYNGLELNSTGAAGAIYGSPITTCDTSTFTPNLSDITYTNNTGSTYVAYLFADSNSGGFGAAGTDSVVACGSYTGNGSDQTITLGWEPQFVLVKPSNQAGWGWYVFDNMRGLNNTTTAYLEANTTAAEATGASATVTATATGFRVSGSSIFGASGYNLIYLAIRRGPMKTPTDATKVFSPVASNSYSGTVLTTGFPVDMQISGQRTPTDGYNWSVNDRLRGISSDPTADTLGKSLITAGSAAEGSAWGSRGWSNSGFYTTSLASNAPFVYHNFRRAPGFFDVVCYTGTGSATTVAHNLGVAPELIIIKVRNYGYGWYVWHKDLGTGTSGYNNLYLNTAEAIANSGNFLATPPTSTVFSLDMYSGTNGSYNYVAYLFASCPGVSKVGSYTGSGTTKQIDCGFTSGARFVLIKRTDSTGDWTVWDTARGIVSGNDPYLLLNSTAAEVTNTDYIDPYSAGFEISSSAPAAINASGGTFIYLAIA